MSAVVALVWTTFPDQDRAREVVRVLVEEGLVACAQVEGAPVHSTYRWKGQIESADEFRVLLKLPGRSVERLRTRLCELHPYEVPEFVVGQAQASDAYARWVEDCCP